jgi:hypothetical protein
MLNTQDPIAHEHTQPNVKPATARPRFELASLRTVIEPKADSAPSKDAEERFDCVVKAICRDAQTNTKDYLLRSNTGHDGE